MEGLNGWFAALTTVGSVGAHATRRLTLGLSLGGVSNVAWMVESLRVGSASLFCLNLVLLAIHCMSLSLLAINWWELRR